VNAVADPGGILSLDAARAFLRDLIDALPLDSRQKRQRADLAGKNLSLYQMWSFPAADVSNPFSEIGDRRAEVVNILGVGYFADESPNAELVRFAHTLPAGVTAHLPTAWDAEFECCWRPKGRTYQLDRDEYGVREVVHVRIAGENLTVAIESIP